MKKQNTYIITGLCLSVLGGALAVGIKVKIERRKIIMKDLKVPNFMKKQGAIGQDNIGKYLAVNHPITAKGDIIKEEVYFDDETENTPSEMPVEPRISLIKADIHEESIESAHHEEYCANEALAVVEVEKIKSTIRGMIRDEAHLEIVLNEIPMHVIIAHISKKWEEAEAFRRNISMALGCDK